jgi:hypothetical protein
MVAVSDASPQDEGQMSDFFISYNSADKGWAEWIAWTLEEAGWSCIIQAWDFRPGENFVLKMQEATREASRTIAVLSPEYLGAKFTQPEWAAAFVGDPQGLERKLIPLRVKPCSPPGLLSALIYVDLVGLSQEDARAALLSALDDRVKPLTAPAFPGSVSPAPVHAPQAPAPFPTSSAPSAEAAIRAKAGAYDLGAVLELVRATLSDEEVSELAMTRFHAIYGNFAAGQTLGSRIRDLISYAEKRKGLETILEFIRERYPERYAGFEPRLRG